MSFSSNFEVKATLYFRVHDAELYGGPGTVGFAKQSFELIPGAKLEDLNDIMAISMGKNKGEFYEQEIFSTGPACPGQRNGGVPWRITPHCTSKR